MSRKERLRAAMAEKFRAIARDRLETVYNSVVRLESEPQDSDTARVLMREMHTLKGEAKLSGFPDASRLAHGAEELLIAWEEAGFAADTELVSGVFRACDQIGDLIAGRTQQVDVEAACEAIEGLLATRHRSDRPLEERPADVASAATATPEPSQRGALKRLLGVTDESTLRIDVRKVESLTELVGDLATGQNVIARQVETVAALAEAWQGSLQGSREALRAVQQSRDLPLETMQATIDSIAASLDKEAELVRELAAAVVAAREGAFETDVRMEALEGQVRDLRLLPLAALLSRYPRAIRDLAREQGKKVRIDVTGADVEVDKQVLDRINEPLLHLVRNAVDHGLETPEQRVAAGKPELGRILLSARARGALVEIVIQDDGHGVDLERVRQAAVRRRLLAEQEAASASEDTLLGVLFLPGMSTREEATEVSGRGIGLDVVKQGIENLGGTISMQTASGQGATFVLSIPISVVLSRALVVALNGTYYAVPSEAVTYVGQLGAGDLESAGEGQAFRLDGTLVSVVGLGAVLGVPGSGGADSAELMVMVVRHHGQQVGLLVDRLAGEHVVIQRSLDPFLGGSRLFSSSAALSDGDLAFVLNVPELIRATTSIPVRHAFAGERDAVTVAHRILVIDDSEVTRDMVVGVLRDHGFDVSEAVNGRAGLDSTLANAPALVVTDLEMPVLDGFGYLRELRAQPGMADLPVIVLSTRGSDVDKRRAAEAGADAYLVKAEFTEDKLVGLIDRLLIDANANR